MPDSHKPPRLFLLSPANASGQRARMLRSDRASFPVATRLRSGDATLAEVFSFVSGLYFRGKVAYCSAFAGPPTGVAAGLVITPGRGLLPLECPVSLDDLDEIAAVPLEEGETTTPNPRFLEPLQRDARELRAKAGNTCDVILLGSIATAKYVDPLLEIFGERLLFPAEFVGRGDMSRGGLMLRAAEAASELSYVPVLGAIRRGPRPPKLPKLKHIGIKS